MSFQVVPYGASYFLRTAAPALSGTQLAMPRMQEAADGSGNITVLPQSNFTMMDATAPGDKPYWVTPHFVPKAGSMTNLTLLLQDTDVSLEACSEYHYACRTMFTRTCTSLVPRFFSLLPAVCVCRKHLAHCHTQGTPLTTIINMALPQAPEITFDVISMAPATGWTFSIAGTRHPVKVDANSPWIQDTSVPGRCKMCGKENRAAAAEVLFTVTFECQHGKASAPACLQLFARGDSNS